MVYITIVNGIIQLVKLVTFAPITFFSNDLLIGEHLLINDLMIFETELFII